ncbi:hypothetical protein ABIA39_000881 [Nocardia sp. GAS34]|uniref:serine hydrolase n=1 Tax=unclassified Nocardia TaxID=2637762 RepID=UPI003D19B4E6
MTDTDTDHVAAQLQWIIEASVADPAPTASEIATHLAPTLLENGGSDSISTALASLGPLTMGRIHTRTADHVHASMHGRDIEILLDLTVSPTGLIDSLAATLVKPAPTSWAELDARLATLAPRASFAAMEIRTDGHCELIHGHEAEVPRPTGSAFKLYVLGALGQAVAQGSARWDESLRIREDHRSPAGTMQYLPAGTEAPLSEYADLMISLSDNTATDHLLHRLGREAVQRQLALFGHASPETNRPFPSTKAFFQFKFDPDSGDAHRYPRLSEPERLAMLERLEARPLPDPRRIWPEPRFIDSIEWFASPADICRAYAGLASLDQPEIDHALSLGDAGIGLDRNRFPTVWYKGGQEPGVLTLQYLVRTKQGHGLVVALLMSDPETALDAIAPLAEGQALIRGAFDLMDDAG